MGENAGIWTSTFNCPNAGILMIIHSKIMDGLIKATGGLINHTSHTVIRINAGLK